MMPKSHGSVVTFEDAAAVAVILLRRYCFKGVMFFGSVARKGQGNDLDLILLVSKDLEDYFLRLVNDSVNIRMEWSNGAMRNTVSKKDRWWALHQMFGRGFMKDLREVQKIFDHKRIDIFLFALDWQNRLDELQRVLPHEDLKFMENIACTAKRIA